MKYLIASDIHGSAFWCRKLLKRFEEEKADGLWLLGDILYHGPRNDLPDEYAPKKVIAMLNPLKNLITCVHGNCDAVVDQMVLDFPIMNETKFINIGKKKILLTHGHDINKDTFRTVEARRMCQNLNFDYLLYGHFHIPVKCCVDGVWCLNPGSVSIPKENSPHSYMVYNGEEFVWKDLDGNIYDTLVGESNVMYN